MPLAKNVTVRRWATDGSIVNYNAGDSPPETDAKYIQNPEAWVGGTVPYPPYPGEPGGSGGGYIGPRPFPIYAAGASHAVSGADINGARGALSGVTAFEAGDLILALSARDQTQTENQLASRSKKTYSPSVGRGWWPVAGVQHTIVMGHRWASGVGDISSPETSHYALVTNTVSECASAVIGIRGVGNIQDAKSFEVSAAADMTLPALDVDMDDCLAILAVHASPNASDQSIYPSNPAANATPAGWTHLASGSRWAPACSFFSKEVDTGTIASFATDNVAAYAAAKVSGAILFILQPVVA